MRFTSPALFLLLLPLAARAADRSPNVLFMLADDLGYGDVGFNGRTDWPTPHLDRLAREGTVFTRWYAPGVVCGPSRAAILTGLYGIHNGVVANNDDLPADRTTIAKALKARGYATGLFGKWHAGRARPGTAQSHPLDYGFDEFMGFTNAVAAWEHFPKTLFFGHESKPVHGNADALFADAGIDFLRRYKDGPFFLELAFITPHLRIEVEPEYLAPFRGKFPEKNPAKPSRATYAGMINRLDHEIGRVLAALDELGLAKDTLVVFSSDQGATFEVGNEGASAFHDSNRPFRGQKRTVWEGGIRVPGVVRWPGRVPAGKSSGEVIHMIDLFPTFLAAAGVPAAGADGADVLDVWQGQAKAPERTLFWEWRSEKIYQTAAMRGDMKLVVTGGNPPELFDVIADLAERRSVIAEHPDLAKRLEGELKAWLATETEAAK